MNIRGYSQYGDLKVGAFLALRRSCRPLACKLFSLIAFCLLPILSGNLAAGQNVSPEPDLLDLLETYSSEHEQASEPNKSDRAAQAPMNYTVQNEELHTPQIVPANFSSNVTTEQIVPDFVGKAPQRASAELQLWRDRITAIEYEEHTKGKEELQKTLEQLRSIEFESSENIAEHVGTSEPTLVTESIESDEAAPEKKVPKDPNDKPQESLQKSVPQPPLSKPLVTDRTLTIVRDLCKNPAGLENPFELAEVMFLSGHLREASILYRQAIERQTEKEDEASRDRAWILFQIGNCLRYEDRTEASRMYKQLITDYPDSPWTNLAKAQVKLIDLYLKEKLQELIENSTLQ